MKATTGLPWHPDAFLQGWRWKSRPKGGCPAISPERRALMRRLSRENTLGSAETIQGHLVLLGYDSPSAYRSPWQNPFAERSVRTLRRELLDHVIVLNAEHLKRLLKEYVEEHYHQAGPHQGLGGDTPFPSAKLEPEAGASRLASIPLVGGLHHRSVRVAA